MRLGIRAAVWAAVVGVPLAWAATGPVALPAWEAAAAAAAPHTAERAAAALRAWQAQQHPMWRDLSPAQVAQQLVAAGQALVRRLDVSSTEPAAASFLGNRSGIVAPSGSSMVWLRRQADCSLTQGWATYTYSLTAPTLQTQGTAANVQNTLHSAAGLSTQANTASGPCAEPSVGLGMRRGFYLGRTADGSDMFAATGYHFTADQNVVWVATADPATFARRSFGSANSKPQEIGGAITVGDLNGDGLLDVVGLGLLTGTATVWLARSDGTLGTGTVYTLPGVKGTAAVMADFNGDGKIDLAASSLDASNVERLSVLPGNGDGTLGAAQSVTVTTPGFIFLANLVAVDLRGTGRLDIVGSNGVVLLNNGSGGFTQGGSAFAALSGTSSYGPNLAAADFNKDGKADVAVNNGTTIRIALGRGDGTFTAGRAYASNDAVGFLSATDLDRDGNVDLYVGLANGGAFAGDQFEAGKVYALMGNGDGSFQGVPVLPFTYTGRNLVDLNGDGKLDAVGVNSDASFTTYLGDGRGGFTARSTLPVSSISNGSESFSLSTIESFAFGDVNGDGKTDLVFFGRDFVARLVGGFFTPGLLISLGNGQGDFAAPTFVPAPAFAPAGDFDTSLKLVNLRVADVNADGKADLVYGYSTDFFTARQLVVGTAVQLGNGNGTFQDPKVIVFHSGPDNTSFFLTALVHQITDLNGDGRADLVMAAQTTNLNSASGGYLSDIQVALGAGDGSFAAPVTVPGPQVFARQAGLTEQAPIVVADMDGDGRRDIVALGGSTAGSMQVSVALGNGDGTFKAAQTKTFGGQYITSQQHIAVGDFNGDGKADVLMADPFTGGSGIALGNGDGTLQGIGTAAPFKPNLVLNLPVGGTAVALDLNGDAKTDALVGSAELLAVDASAAPAQPDFAIGTSSSTGTVKAGSPAQTTVTFTPGSGFSGTVSFSCTGLPAGAACSFSPASVSAAGGAASTALTITTTAAAGAAVLHGGDGPGLPPTAVAAALATLLMAALLVTTRRPGGRRRTGAALLAAGAGALALQACGGGGGGSAGTGGSGGGTSATPPGTYTVTIQASDGSVTRSVPYTLVVN